MDRAERRRQERASQGKPRLTSTGLTIKVDGSSFERVYQSTPENDVEPGEHLWAMFLMHKVNNLDNLFAGNWHADLESLILTTGPGCFICEQTYSPDVAASPCPGQPPGELGYH